MFMIMYAQGAITYQLNSDSITWSHVFYKLEANRERLLVMDYSVSQTTLEQVIAIAMDSALPLCVYIGISQLC